MFGVWASALAAPARATIVSATVTQVGAEAEIRIRCNEKTGIR